MASNQGSKRLQNDLASLNRARANIMLDSDLDPQDVKAALTHIDAAMVALSTLKRQKEVAEKAEDDAESSATAPPARAGCIRRAAGGAFLLRVA